MGSTEYDAVGTDSKWPPFDAAKTPEFRARVPADGAVIPAKSHATKNLLLRLHADGPTVSFDGVRIDYKSGPWSHSTRTQLTVTFATSCN